MTDMLEPLSEHFTWAEATHSETAIRLGIDNTPPLSVRGNIRSTAAKMDRLRKFVGQQIQVTSWYRCLDLNRALRSQHQMQLKIESILVAMERDRKISEQQHNALSTRVERIEAQRMQR